MSQASALERCAPPSLSSSISWFLILLSNCSFISRRFSLSFRAAAAAAASATLSRRALTDASSDATARSSHLFLAQQQFVNFPDPYYCGSWMALYCMHVAHCWQPSFHHNLAFPTYGNFQSTWNSSTNTYSTQFHTNLSHWLRRHIWLTLNNFLRIFHPPEKKMSIY